MVCNAGVMPWKLGSEMAGKPAMPERGEGRGGYIEMATLLNTEKWITPG